MEKVLTDHDVIKEFSCGCRSWQIRKGDSPHNPNETDKVFTVYHGPNFKTCDKIIVYQQKRAIKRYFIKPKVEDYQKIVNKYERH